MRRREGRFVKSLYEGLSIRKPSVNDELPRLIDIDGNSIAYDVSVGGGGVASSLYTFDGIVQRGLISRKNIGVGSNFYTRDDAYYVHFRVDIFDYVSITDEVLWHQHVEREGDVPTLDELIDTYKGVLLVEAFERHRGRQRLFCSYRDIE